MGRLQLARVGLLVAIAETQALLPCSVGTSVLTVATSEDAATLANSLRCLYGDFAVQWIGEVMVAETIRVSNGTSLNVTGDEEGATADGGSRTQLFVVEGGSWVHFTDMSFANGNASSGGAIFADDRSGVSFRGPTAFTGNVARGGGGGGGDGDGGAIFAKYSTLRWDGGGDATFAMNSASRDGGAIYALWSDVSWKGGANTIFADNSADGYGGAIHAHGTTASWDQHGVQFRNNQADNGGAITAEDSSLSWNGQGAYFNHNSAAEQGGAIFADGDSILSWDVSTTFSNNEAEKDGGALALSYMGDDTTVFSIYGGAFISNSAARGRGGAIYVEQSGVNFENVTFQSNSASVGGAVANSGVGYLSLARFSRCSFVGNTAVKTGGAIETLFGAGEFRYSSFEGNSAGEQPLLK